MWKNWQVMDSHARITALIVFMILIELKWEEYLFVTATATY